MPIWTAFAWISANYRYVTTMEELPDFWSNTESMRPQGKERGDLTPRLLAIQNAFSFCTLRSFASDQSAHVDVPDRWRNSLNLEILPLAKKMTGTNSRCAIVATGRRKERCRPFRTNGSASGQIGPLPARSAKRRNIRGRVRHAQQHGLTAPSQCLLLHRVDERCAGSNRLGPCLLEAVVPHCRYIGVLN